MRVLEFIVNDQILSKNPECNFDNIVPGTTGYLKAHFSFSKEWNGAAKAASFWYGDKECTPQLLRDGCTCMISEDALKGSTFGVSLVGKRGEQVITTNRVEVKQRGGKA